MFQVGTVTFGIFTHADVLKAKAKKASSIKKTHFCV